MKSVFFGVVATAFLSVVAAHAQTQTQKPAPPPTPPRPAPQAAPAPEKPTGDEGAEATTAMFGDWQLRCWRADAAAQVRARMCEIIQSAVASGQATPLSQIAIGRPESSRGLFLTVVVPVNTSFAAPVRVLAGEGDKETVDVAWSRCLPTACFATIPATNDMIRRWRQRNETGRMTYVNGAGAEIALPISFRGLARALDALAREQPN